MFSLDMICHCPTCVAFQSRKIREKPHSVLWIWVPQALQAAPPYAGCFSTVRVRFLSSVLCWITPWPWETYVGTQTGAHTRTCGTTQGNHPGTCTKISRTIRNQWRSMETPERKPLRAIQEATQEPQPELAPEPPEHPEPARNSHQELHRTFGLRP